MWQLNCHQAHNEGIQNVIHHKKEHKFQFIKPTNPKQGLKEGQVVSKGTQIQYKVKIKAYIKMIDHEENYKF